MNKKDMVIQKARELFTKYGYKKVSMDEVAREANVTKKTIYTYFKDKEDMFKYFIKEELEEMKIAIENQEKKNIPFIEVVSHSIYSMLKFRKESILFSNILKEYHNTQDNSFLKLYDDEIIRYIENKITREMRLDNIKKCDAHLTAFIIYNIYISIMFEYDKDLDEKQVTEEITSILKDGLLN